jgi:RimJ/RimL family protein N-acetyltransferase
MTQRLSELGLPIGADLSDWTPRRAPPRATLEGQYATVVPFDAELHCSDLHAANRSDSENRIWTYLAYGPFESEDDYREFMRALCATDDPQFYAVVDKQTGKAGGIASYLRINPDMGVIEVGHINYAPPLQRTIAATEAMFLMMKHVFDDLGYRRYEWKCDALNARSCRAAERLGFTYEGTFRQAMVYSGRNRDTAWYSIMDSEWLALKSTFEGWLNPSNFDTNGHQICHLGQANLS